MKEKAIVLLQSEGLSQNRALKALGFCKATYFYRKVDKDTKLVNEIRRLAFRRKQEGYRIIHKKLCRKGILANHKKVYRIYKEEGLKVRTKPKQKRYDIPRKSMLIPENPNELWSIDFVHERTTDGRKQRILTGIDICSRENMILKVSYSFSAQRVIQVLDELPLLPKGFLIDNGTEFTSKIFQDWAKMKNIELYFIQPGKPTLNAFIESFNGKLRNECLNPNVFKNQKELAEELSSFQAFYNNERLHSSLNYLTPNEFKMNFA